MGSLILAASATAGNAPQGHVNIDAYNELQKIAENDREYIRQFIKLYNENYDIFQNGKYYRLSDPKTDDYAVFEYVYENRVIVGAMRLKTHALNLQTTIKLKGLDENHIYTDKKSGEKYYGSQLMQYGIQIGASKETNDFNAFIWDFC